MQNFAINGGSLNGDPEVWFDESPAIVAFQAAGEGMRGAMGSGTAQCSIVSSGALALHARLTGQADVVLAASGSITYGVALEGSAPIQFAVYGEGVRWAMLEGLAPTVLELNGDIQVVPAISATFVMTLASVLDLHVATGQHAEGITPIEVRTAFDAKVAKSLRLVGYAPIEFAGIGYPALTIQSPPGAGSIRFNAAGSARFGSKIGLEGEAGISLFSVADLGVLHYVYAEGVADIGIIAEAARHGIPNIPGLYVEAPAIRVLRVGEEARRFIVPAERRI